MVRVVGLRLISDGSGIRLQGSWGVGVKECGPRIFKALSGDALCMAGYHNALVS